MTEEISENVQNTEYVYIVILNKRGWLWHALFWSHVGILI